MWLQAYSHTQVLFLAGSESVTDLYGLNRPRAKPDLVAAICDFAATFVATNRESSGFIVNRRGVSAAGFRRRRRQRYLKRRVPPKTRQEHRARPRRASDRPIPNVFVPYHRPVYGTRDLEMLLQRHAPGPPVVTSENTHPTPAPSNLIPNSLDLP